MRLFSTKYSDSDNDLATTVHFPTSKNALIIFTRNPELGKCKTRLAKTIGENAALEIYKYLLKHTANIAKEANADKYVFYSKNIKKEDLWNSDIFKKKLQYGNDLGERMENAFSELFQLGYQSVVIIGSDIVELTTEHIKKAFQTLNTHEVVIGPAKDGGYYLLGLKKMNSDLFKNKEWGTSSVLKDTLIDIKNTPFSLLEELNDIDTFEDIKPYKEFDKFYNTND